VSNFSTCLRLVVTQTRLQIEAAVFKGLSPFLHRFPPPQPQLADAVVRVLGSTVAFTPANTLERGAGEKRKYDGSNRVAKPPKTARALKVTSVENILDGSCFPAGKRPVPDGESRTCCSKGCNHTFGASEGSIERVRARVPKSGKGQQEARKIYVRTCLQDKTLTLTDHAGISAAVCYNFFVHVTGCSKKLITSAMALGGCGM